MDPADQQGGRRVPASFLLTAGSKRQRPDTTNKAQTAKGGSDGALKAAVAAPAPPVSLAASGLAQAADRKPEQGPGQLEGQGDAASGSTGPGARPPGPRKLPGSFAPQAPRAVGASGASAASRAPVVFNPEDTQVSRGCQHIAQSFLVCWPKLSNQTDS